MVYSGRPSKGCLHCRQRRIKVPCRTSSTLLPVSSAMLPFSSFVSDRWQCDLSRPSCGQCNRSERECAGYRDQMQLSFRDETQGVVKKAQLRSDRSKIGHSQQCKPTGPVEDQVLPRGLTASSTPPAFLSIDAVDQAVAFFFRSHVNEASESCSLVYKDLPGLYAAEYNSALSCVIKAIGLAGLSSYRSAPALMTSAFAHYSLALGFVGSALRNQALATTDQTLLTIYLLGIYEVQSSTILQAF